MISTTFLCLSESECEAHLACDSGRGHCRDKCNSWEEEAMGMCGSSCTCCVAKVDGEQRQALLERLSLSRVMFLILRYILEAVRFFFQKTQF